MDLMTASRQLLEHQIEKLESKDCLYDAEQILLRQCKKELSIIDNLEVEIANIISTPEEFDKLIKDTDLYLMSPEQHQMYCRAIMFASKVTEAYENIYCIEHGDAVAFKQTKVEE